MFLHKRYMVGLVIAEVDVGRLIMSLFSYHGREGLKLLLLVVKILG